MSVDHIKLYLNKESSDVTLVVDGKELPAHRSILSERSEYFSSMFSTRFTHIYSNKIFFKDVNLFAFEKVLEYIYTGDCYFIYHCSDDEACQIYMCALYFGVDELVKQLRSYFKHQLQHDAPLQTLNLALLYQANDLIFYADRIIPKIAPFEITNEIFEQLSFVTVEHLLKLKLNTDDFTVFQALIGWMRANPDYSDCFPELLKQFDLYLLDENQLEVLFEPVELVDRSFCQSLLKEQRKEAMRVQKVVNENVIDPTNFRLVYGKTSDLTPMEVTPRVGVHMRDWEQVINHSKYTCTDQQVLYFNERPVRFVFIETPDTSEEKLIKNIEALYSTDPFEIDPETTLTIPKQNVVQMTTIVDDVSFWGFTPHSDIVSSATGERCQDLLRGHIKNKLGDSLNGHIGHKLGSFDGIVYKFQQPYFIGSMKLLLNEKSSYMIAISTNDSDWTCVFEEENVSGWRIATFEKQPVLYIRVYGTYAPSDFFNLYKLECPATF